MDIDDLADELDEITFRVLANARNRTQARQRVAVIGYWARQQAARLNAGAPPRVDHAAVVAEALAGERCATNAGPPAA